MKLGRKVLTLEQSVGPVGDGYTSLDSPLYSSIPLPECQEKHRLPLEGSTTEALYCYASVEDLGNHHILLCQYFSSQLPCVLPSVTCKQLKPSVSLLSPTTFFVLVPVFLWHSPL